MEVGTLGEGTEESVELAGAELRGGIERASGASFGGGEGGDVWNLGRVIAILWFDVLEGCIDR